MHRKTRTKWGNGPKTQKPTYLPWREGDFFANEKSATITEQTAGKGRIEFVGTDGSTKVLKESVTFDKGDVVDATKMSVKALRQFFKDQVADAKKEPGVLFSLHMKATMMKVSDPIIFGHCVSVYYEDVFKKHEKTFKELGVNPNNGIGDVYAKIGKLPQAQQNEIKDRSSSRSEEWADLGDGGFRQRHYQPSRAERYHH